MKKKSEDTFSKLKSDSSDLIAKAKDAMAAPKEANELILPSDALRIIYFLEFLNKVGFIVLSVYH